MEKQYYGRKSSATDNIEVIVGVAIDQHQQSIDVLKNTEGSTRRFGHYLDTILIHRNSNSFDLSR